MKSGVKALVVCGCVFGFWSTRALAVPVVLEMKVVKVNGVDVVPTNTITIAPGDTIEVDFFASSWTPFELLLYQMTLDGATLENSPESYIDLVEIPCVDGDDCPTSVACEDEGVCNCLGSITLDDLRPDYVFFKRAFIFAGSCPEEFEPGIPPRSYAMGALVFGGSGEPDPGVPRYLGTMMLQVSEGALGTFAITILDLPDFTFFSDAEVASFDLDLRTLTIIAGGVCGDNVVNQADEQCDGTDDAACPGECMASCTCPGGVEVPTVSQWGLIVLAILLLAISKVYFGTGGNGTSAR